MATANNNNRQLEFSDYFPDPMRGSLRFEHIYNETKETLLHQFLAVEQIKTLYCSEDTKSTEYDRRTMWRKTKMETSDRKSGNTVDKLSETKLK